MTKRAEIITSLLEKKLKLHPSIIEEFGEKFRFHPKTKGRWFDIYNEFTDEALKVAYDCFIEHKLDRRGRFLEYRFAQWLANKDKRIKKIEIDKKIQGVGEIDVVGYDRDGNIISIAECKARKGKASKEEIDPWLRTVELIFDRTEQSLKRAYFVNIAGFTDGIKKRMLENKNIDSKGFFLLEYSRAKLKGGSIIFGYKAGVEIFLCEERAGKIKRIFP